MDQVDALRELLDIGGVVVLSGAGLSTDSGIPDYRGPDGVLRSRLPMTIAEFTGSPEGRRRYWARSQVGWRRIAAATPNPGHHAVAELERRGQVRSVITQNVDGLHQAAGSVQVTELHGSLAHVVCLACGARSSRRHLQQRLETANRDLDLGRHAAPHRANPDGDAELDEATVSAFRLVTCERCGSDLLKPDVVFFGENVPAPRVADCYAQVEAASSLLVLGSSLTVMSGLRFVRRAHARSIPVAIVNQGATRGDPEATLRLDAPLADVLGELVPA